MFAFLLLAVLANGIIVTDNDIGSIFCVIRRGCDISSVPVSRQILFESVGPNLLGVALDLSGLNAFAARFAWLAIGYALCGLSLWRAFRRGALDARDFLAVALLSHLPETSVRWVGKSDGYLVAALVGVATSERGWLRNLFAAAAIACHPPIGLLATLAIAFVETDRPRRLDLGFVATILASFVGANLAAKGMAPGFASRGAFFLQNLTPLLHFVWPHALSFLAACFGPLAAFLLAGGMDLSKTGDRGGRIRLGLALLGVFVVAAFGVTDHSRDFTLLSLPVLIWTARKMRLNPLGTWQWAAIGLIALAGPHLGPYGYDQ